MESRNFKTRAGYTVKQRQLSATRELKTRGYFELIKGFNVYKQDNAECPGDCQSRFPSANLTPCEPDYYIFTPAGKSFFIEVTGSLKAIKKEENLWLSECKVKNAVAKFKAGHQVYFFHFIEDLDTGLQIVRCVDVNADFITYLKTGKTITFRDNNTMHIIPPGASFVSDISDKFEDDYIHSLVA